MATKKLSQLTRSTQSVLMVPGLLDNHAGGYNNVLTDERYLLTPTEVMGSYQFSFNNTRFRCID